jgi:membrane-associated phospholipid phosphatase
MVLYLTWFSYLEKSITAPYQLIFMKVDNYIPFMEIFIIPYFLWFLYVAVVMIYLILFDKNEYYRSCIFLITGMTIFLIISTIWPNGHNLRPDLMGNENILARMVGYLYSIDTPTNLWPSIHVFNSLGAHLAVMHSPKLRQHKWLRWSSLVLCTSIILSTVFLKQHSFFDVITALIMGIVLYLICYQHERLFGWATRNANKRTDNLAERSTGESPNGSLDNHHPDESFTDESPNNSLADQPKV